MTRLTREEQRYLTVRKLRGAALQEVAQAGFAAATIDRISEKAGFSRGAFYSNFNSKEELVLELLEQDNSAEMNAWVDMIAAAANMDELYARMAERFAAYIARTDWSLFLLELQLHAKRSADFNAHYRQHMKKTDVQVRNLIAALFTRAERTPPADLDLLAVSLRNYSTALSVEACWEEDASQPQKMAELIVIFLRGLVAQGQPINNKKSLKRG